MNGRLLDFFKVRWLSAELSWTLAALAAAALAVQITGTGIDILALMTLGVAIVLFDNAFGDKFTDVLGPTLWSVVLLSAALLGGWGLVKKNGAADRFFRSAERAGYETLYYDSSARPLTRTADANPAPAPVRQRAAQRSGEQDPAVTPSSGRSAPASVASAAGAATSSVGTAFSMPTLSPWRGVTKKGVLRLEAPGIATTNSNITIRAHFTIDGDPLSGASVAFTVADRVIAVKPTDDRGIATAMFSTPVPAQYQLRAHFEGTETFREASAAAVLHVIPGK